MSTFERRHERDISFGSTLLAEAEDATAASYVDIANNMIVKFGRSLSSVSPHELRRSNAAVENGNSEEIFEILGMNNDNTNATNNETEFGNIEAIIGSFSNGYKFGSIETFATFFPNYHKRLQPSCTLVSSLPSTDQSLEALPHILDVFRGCSKMKRFWRRRHGDATSRFTPLTERGDVSASSHPSELNNMIVQFGRSLLNVSPEDIPRLTAVVENDNSEEISEIIGTKHPYCTTRNDETEFRSIDVFQDTFFRMAVKDCKTEWVECFLNKIADKSIPFTASATMMKESFNDLWLDYRSFLEDMMKKDVLGWDVCTIEVPIETFTVEYNLGSRVGTCDTVLEWIRASQNGTAFDYWKCSNQKGVNKVLNWSRRRKVNAILRIFCLEDVCKTGHNGIVRTLLLQKTPAYLYKTPLIKWIILFKWERIWRARTLKNLVFYFMFFVVFNVFLLLVSLDIPSLYPLLDMKLTTVVFAASMQLLAIVTLRREQLQLKRYIYDAGKIYPSSRFRGIRHYLGSRQNQTDLLLCGALLAFLPEIWRGRSIPHMLRYAQGYFTLPAIALLLMWAKAVCHAQTFKRTGVFLLMLGRVIKECLPYFLILVGIMIGFGLTMRVAVLGFLSEDSYADNEIGADLSNSSLPNSHEKIDSSFGSPLRAIVTMAYAMVGMFDPEVLIDCNSLSWFVVPLFVLYLIIQMIIMFNMLIAAMGDAFDGVRADEEESFLMARARFIDQNEASLTDKEIQIIESKIGKYLYVLIPEDKQLENTMPFWKGRIRAIKEDVKTIVDDAQETIVQEMSEMIKGLKDEIKNEIATEIKKTEDRFTALEQRNACQDHINDAL